ncbi:putative SP-containing membrane protein [Vairimorpha necatrix]|uniref:SP-containing membrane protein n=1 Tax=Vairimorpha necatrix TaxID=6039 RepID=A0AAX4JCD5_9MICR
MKYLHVLRFIVLLSNVNNTSNNVVDLLKSVISNIEICDSLDSTVYLKTQSDDSIRSFYDIVWNEITNHEIFINLTQNNTSENNWDNRRSTLYECYLERLGQQKWDYNITNLLTSSEKIFLNNIINITVEYFNMLRVCYKDNIIKSNSTQETFEEIIRENTCFIQNNHNSSLPIIVYKKCKSLIKAYYGCYGKESVEFLYDKINQNQKQMLIANCMDENYDFKNATYDIITNLENIIDEDYTSNKINNVTEHIVYNMFKTFHENRTDSFLNVWFIVFIGFMLIGTVLFIGYKFYRRNKIQRSYDVELQSIKR